MPMKTYKYEVIVSGIGFVHECNNYVEACGVYGDYKRLSKGKVGRASGESVTLLVNGEPKLEYIGELSGE